MSNSKLIKERNLDPELLAKILSSGSSVDVRSLLKDYLKKTDKIEKKQLGDTVINYIEDMTGQASSGLGAYYRKGEQIDINDIPQSLISDVSNATTVANKAEKEMENMNQTIADSAATEVNNYIKKIDLVNTTYNSVKKNLDDTYNPKFNYYDEQIPNLITSTNTNVQAIASIQEQYRRKDTDITYDDLASDVTNKFEDLNTSIEKLDINKQDKLYGINNSILRMNNNLPSTGNLYVTGPFVYNGIDRSYAAETHMQNFIDFSTYKEYTTKYKPWNSSQTYDSVSVGILNNTVSDVNDLILRQIIMPFRMQQLFLRQTMDISQSLHPMQKILNLH